MTDREIIQALECCTGDEWDICDKCPYQKYKTKRGCTYHILRDVLDLITRQQAEIEELKEVYHATKLGWATAKAEAIKEFAEMVDKAFGGVGACGYSYVRYKTRCIVKEMIGE